MSNSKFMEKVDEYSRMQEEGMDVMHSTFIHLKHFPFFRDVSSWFLPFTLQYSAFKGTPEIGLSFLEIIMQASYMCNSDKYSLYFGLLQLPIEHRQALVNQMHSQLGDMNRQLAEDLKNKVGKTGNKIGQYIQDLYRFYKLFPRHTEFNDIFNLRLDFHCLPLLTPYLSDTETWTDIAGLYLRKGYFEDAQTIYEQLIACDANNETYYQKRGYCKQMTGDWRGALEDYLRSEMLNPDSKWVIRRIAGCYRALKQPDEALKFYLRYEQQYPGHIPTLIQTGHCYMDLKNYAEALKCYFKADYLDPENHKAERAIAWCSFLIGKYEQAQRYYGKIMDNDPQTQDFINAGHTEWALQNLKQALACYCQAVQSEEEGDFGNFLKLFEQDVPCLVQAGINPQEILLLMDQLRYETVENG
jgi:tetratricopeptide (TPR) repeat protein